MLDNGESLAGSNLGNYERVSKTLDVPRILRGKLVEVSSHLSTRGQEDHSRLAIPLSELLAGAIPLPLDPEQADDFRRKILSKSFQVEAWYAQGTSLATAVSVLLADQLALCPTQDAMIELLSSMPMLGLWQAGYKDIPLITGVSENDIQSVRDTAERVYAGYKTRPVQPEEKKDPSEWLFKLWDHDDSNSSWTKKKETLIKSTSPIIVASQKLQAQGGPILTPVKQNLIAMWAEGMK